RPAQAPPRLARPDHPQPRPPPAAGPPPPAPRPAYPTPPPQPARRQRAIAECRSRRLTSITKEPSRRHLHRLWDATQQTSRKSTADPPGGILRKSRCHPPKAPTPNPPPPRPLPPPTPATPKQRRRC